MRRALLVVAMLVAACAACLAQPPVEAPLLSTVVLESIPPGASVYGQDYVPESGSGFLGVTPVRLLLDPRRSHDFYVVRAGYATARFRVNPGQTRLLADLSPSTPVGWLTHHARYSPFLTLSVVAAIGTLVLSIRRWRRRRGQPHEDPEKPVMAGEYEIVSRLGAGADADVFHARHRTLGEDVALKILKRDGLDDESLARFHREMEIGRDLLHPRVVRVYGFGEVDGLPYLAMELLRGETLQARLTRGPLSVHEAARIAIAVCDGLQACHARGIVHRDLKPTNIMLTADGDVRVLDFGVARLADRKRLTATGAPLGTPMYVAPEQVRGRADERSDLYSLGVILFEALAGRPPFDANDAIGLMMAHCSEEPPRLGLLVPHIPAALDEIVARLLQKDPQRRLQSAEEVRRALEAVFVCEEVVS